MSQFIIFHLDHLSKEKTIELTVELHTIATKNNFGVWFSDRYIEEFEEKIIQDNDNIFSFSVADNFQFDNCEAILYPWWFEECSEEQFERNIGYIEIIADCCLRYTDRIDLYIGTSGIFFVEEFDDTYKVCSKEIISILRHYYWDLNNTEPDIHFIITSK